MKNRYAVYLVEKFFDVAKEVVEYKTFIGNTFAASEKQAINNVRFRNYGNKRSNYYVNDHGYDRWSEHTFLAEII